MGTSDASSATRDLPWRVARFGLFEVDPAAGELRKGGMRLKLQDQPFQILLMLLKTPGEIVTREALRTALWPADTFVEFDHSLNTAVKKLRQALGDDADNPRFVETLPRKGYKFIAPVQFLEQRGNVPVEQQPVAATRNEFRNPSFASTQKRQLIWAAAIGGIAMLAVIALVVYLVPRHEKSPPSHLTFTPFTSFPGEEVTPAFSPDGSRVAFAWNAGKSEDVQIYVKVLGTEQPVAITSGNSINTFPVWSPDGRYIVFRRACVPLLGHHLLIQASACANGKSGIFMIPSVGGPERLLRETSVVSATGQMSFSPDGKSLAFADIADGRWAIHQMSLDDLSVRRITDPVSVSGDTEPAFSPDGKWVAFARDTNSSPNIYVVPRDGGVAHPITKINGLPVVGGLAWTSDGKGLIYGGFGLWRVALSDGVPEPLTTNIWAFYPSVHGKQVVFADSSWVENIYRIDVTSPKPKITPVIESSRVEESGQFSPDGKTFAFQSTRTGSFEIFRADADGTNQLQLTHLNGPLTGTPNWTPDGKFIVFDSRVGGNADIFAVPGQGGSLRQLTTDPSNEAVPSVSRDGKSIYFASDRGGSFNVWKMPIDGGAASQVTRDGGFFARESPDGQWVYYAKSVSVGGIWRVPVNGGKEEFVMKNLDGYWGYWALSNTGIYFVGGRDLNPTELDFYDFGSKRTTKVLDLPKPVNSGAPGLGISPDGKNLTLTLLESRSSDIILADGLK